MEELSFSPTPENSTIQLITPENGKVIQHLQDISISSSGQRTSIDYMRYKVPISTDDSSISSRFALNVGDVYISDFKLTSQQRMVIPTGIVMQVSTESILGKYDQASYTGVAIEAMRNVNWKDQKILDLGSADGILSIFAILKGAKKAFMVDMVRSELRAKLWSNQVLNKIMSGQIEGEQTTIENILQAAQAGETGVQNTTRFFGLIKNRRLDRMQEYFAKYQNQNFNTIIANLGNWEFYNKADIQAIQLLKYLPTVTTFVGSGYVKNTEHDPSDAYALLQKNRI